MEENKRVVPKRRFANFENNWEERKLKDFGTSTSGTSIESEFDKKGIYKVISIGSYSESSVYTDQGIRVFKNKKTENRILNKDDLTMILNDKTIAGNIIGRVLLIDEDNKYVYNQRTQRIEVNNDVYSSEFLYQFLNSPNIRKQIFESAQGNTQIYVNWSYIQELRYNVPSSYSEQTQIGEFFKTIDNLINLQQQKITKLKKLKSGYLKDMFPKEGESTPKLRFAGFGEPWKAYKIKTIIDKGGSGGTPSTKIEEYYKGDIPFLSISDITKSKGYIYQTEKQISNKGLDNSAAWIVPKESISLAMYASVGKVAILKEDIATSQAFYNMIISDLYIRDFVYQYFIKMETENMWDDLISTGTQANLNAQKVRELVIVMPKNIKEVQKVSKLLNNVDKQISNQETKLEKLKQTKQAYLNEMFI